MQSVAQEQRKSAARLFFMEEDWILKMRQIFSFCNRVQKNWCGIVRVGGFVRTEVCFTQRREEVHFEAVIPAIE
jgi:hypothetical protein